MDARAGADLAHLCKTATHTNTITTSRYNGDALSTSRTVSKLRDISRAANKA